MKDRKRITKIRNTGNMKKPNINMYGTFNFLSFFLISVFLFSCSEAPLKDEQRQQPGGLNVGDIAPDFTAKGINNSEINLAAKLKEGPVVLMFYRGQWCPVCNRHLSNLQDSLKFITEKGGNSCFAGKTGIPGTNQTKIRRIIFPGSR